jgi:hypothetical protein
MNQIPPVAAKFGVIQTRNTKEAALLYALKECTPQYYTDGSLSAFRCKKDGEEICFFCFDPTSLTNLVHSAFSEPGWEERQDGDIPDAVMPAVVALIKTMWHNWERLKTATQGLPLHYITINGNKISISTKEPKA